MNKLVLVARHEYAQRVKRRSFLLATLWLPVLIIVVSVVAGLSATHSSATLPIGYVDHTGLLVAQEPALPGTNPQLTPQPYADETAARQALESGVIAGYLVLPADYLATGQSALYWLHDAPDDAAIQAVQRQVEAALLRDQPEAVRQRALDGLHLIGQSASGDRAISYDNAAGFVTPFAAALLFALTVMSSATYFLEATTAEKENRTIELMVTSLTPTQLIAGKALGLVGVALTQLAIWLATTALALVIVDQFVAGFGQLAVPWSLLGIIGLYFLPSLILVAGIMTTIGATVTELRQGQQIAGLVNFLFTLPLFAGALLVIDPNHPILVVLSLLPTTSFTTIAMRWSLTQVPLWQLVTSWLLLAVSAGASLWLAAVAFRLGMLRYGQQLAWREIMEGLRGGRGQRAVRQLPE